MRILQISDLHLAETGSRRQQILDAEQPFMRHGLWRGYLAHDRNALRELSALVRHRLAGQIDHVVVSGDITCAGTQGDLEFARDFLSSQGPVAGPGLLQGLGCTSRHAEEGWRRVSVIGNHDLWGRYSRGPADLPHFDRAVHVEGALHSAPWVQELGGIGAGWSLLLAGIDSNDGTSEFERLAAIGSCARQCSLLDVMMRNRDQRAREVRALVLHHDPTYEGFAKAINRESRAALDKLVADHRFHVVLAGHTHCAEALASLKHKTLYVRCGTTTQKLTVRASQLETRPRDAGDVRSERRINQANIALVHEVEALDARTARWTFTAYERGGRGRAFTPNPALALATPHIIRL